MFKRHFLVRRRYDALALGGVFASWGISDNVAKVVLGLFIFAGAYLVVSRHRSIRQAPWAFSAVLFLYGALTIVLGLARGEPMLENRQTGYGLIAMAAAFLPMGLVLVAHPLSTAVSGARIGILAVTAFAVGEFLIWGGRIGVGENAAIFAFVVAALGILARAEVERPWRFLPNNRLWFYLSLLPVLLSQTRSVWAVYLIAFAIDGVTLLRRRTGRRRWSFLAAGTLAVLLAIPGQEVVRNGWNAALEQYGAYDRDAATTSSIGIRMAMWQGAADVLADHPLIGVGATERIAAVAEKVPANRDVVLTFHHLHNLFIDEALSNGLLGLTLLAAMFAIFLGSVWRWTANWEVRQAAFLLVLLVVTYGSFHGVMLNETTLLTFYSAAAVTLVGARRTVRVAAPRRPDGGSATFANPHS